VSFCSERGLIPFNYLEQAHLHWSIGIAGLVATVALLYYFYKKRVVFVPVEIEKEDTTDDDLWPERQQ
jgi:hypothetical protein